MNIQMKKSVIKLTAIGYTMDSNFSSSRVLVCDEILTFKVVVKSKTNISVTGRQTYAAAIKSSHTFDCSEKYYSRAATKELYTCLILPDSSSVPLATKLAPASDIDNG